MRNVSVVLLLVFLTGCVTEITGGLPPPAEDIIRLKAQLDLARGYFDSEDWSRARPPLNRALAIDPRSVETHVLLAILSEREAEPEIAERLLEKALNIDPNHPQALNNYGTFLYSHGRFEEALVPLRRLVSNPEYHMRAQAFENLGLTELKVGTEDAAKAAFLRALRLNFRQFRSSLELADIAYSEGNFDSARSYYDGFKSMARQNPRSLCLGIKLGHELGEVDQVASYAMTLKNLYPGSREAKRCDIPQ
ncbi:MAG: type IV pilus biogenesis/stability protein PilW [Gammaproteobacteria bacterium]|nr:type IV pilus biogenesis/stability protein PilW [Gammaproteobacteria bacterium]